MEWVVWSVHETSHEWIEWVAGKKGSTKDEALVNAAKGFVEYYGGPPLKKVKEGPYKVCLPSGMVPHHIPFDGKVRVIENDNRKVVNYSDQQELSLGE